ncbi:MULTISPECIES: hypothetical protein [Halorussus]|uniref:hypothetical protein n=1 Tax=Halorussus TaxID=1070314 RepID=UPI00209ECBFA|nr:hypothetical protein [Halorussus vallis]USZ78723.1 hypothetical protein NGM07_24745 [Halorussus vallis]
MPRTETREDEDPYADVCRGFSTGMLVTVNASTPLQAGTPELEVTHVSTDEPRVTLREDHETVWRLSPSRDGRLRIKKLDTEGFSGRVENVETIEVIGLAE